MSALLIQIPQSVLDHLRTSWCCFSVFSPACAGVWAPPQQQGRSLASAESSSVDGPQVQGPEISPAGEELHLFALYHEIDFSKWLLHAENFAFCHFLVSHFLVAHLSSYLNIWSTLSPEVRSPTCSSCGQVRICYLMCSWVFRNLFSLLSDRGILESLCSVHKLQSHRRSKDHSSKRYQLILWDLTFRTVISTYSIPQLQSSELNIGHVWSIDEGHRDRITMYFVIHSGH